MYALIICSSTAPTVAQKYPHAHKCWPQYLLRNSGNSSWSFRDDRPLMYCTSFAGARCGGADSSIWMWSGDTAPPMITTSRAWHTCRIRSRARSATRPRRILYRYFVIQMTWYLRSKVAWAVCRYSAIPLFSRTSAEAYRLKGGGIKPGRLS